MALSNGVVLIWLCNGLLRTWMTWYPGGFWYGALEEKVVQLGGLALAGYDQDGKSLPWDLLGYRKALFWVLLFN